MMLKGQRKTKEPCGECFLHKDLCICHLIPSLKTKTRLTLIVHHRELKRTTNTGRLAVKALENSEMRVRGESREKMDLSDLISQDYQSLLFFPTENAVELTREFIEKFSKPIHLIVPDGNWRQASKVSIRHPELVELPRVMISNPNTAKHHLRAENSEYGMSTLEAIARAYRILENQSIYESLFGVYQAKLTQTLRGRGQKNL